MATSAACQYKNETYDFTCDEPTRDTGSKFCIFHDTNYLKDDNYDKHKQEVAERFEKKLSEYSSNHSPLRFIGYCLPDISFQSKQFTEAVYFNYATFYGVANFSEATFSELANFSESTFSNEAYFIRAKFSNEANFGKAKFSNEAYFTGAIFSSIAYFSGEFNGLATFNHVIFEKPTKITFDISNMSNVSFSDTDITRIRFSDKVTWGGKDKDKFTIIEEEWLKDKSHPISLDLVLSVYRNLRENYEFRLRYDEAGKFFIREMELKRKYKTVYSKIRHDFQTKENKWLVSMLYSRSINGSVSLFLSKSSMERLAICL